VSSVLRRVHPLDSGIEEEREKLRRQWRAGIICGRDPIRMERGWLQIGFYVFKLKPDYPEHSTIIRGVNTRSHDGIVVWFWILIPVSWR